MYDRYIETLPPV
jgi:hypothetical protein